MEFHKYLLFNEEDSILVELELGSDTTLKKWFNVAIKQVFSQSIIDKIEKVFKKRIDLKFVTPKRKDIEAITSSPREIQINIGKFTLMSLQQKIKLLLHEFIHVLQLKKSFIFLKAFKEFDTITSQLNRVIKRNIKKGSSYSSFLVGTEKDIGRGGKYEILAYILQDKINWKALNPRAVVKIFKILKDSGAFNFNKKFWKDRMNRAGVRI